MMEYTNSHPKQLATIPEVSGRFVTTAYFAAIGRRSARKRSQSARAGIHGSPGPRNGLRRGGQLGTSLNEEF
jgi:hypothetical protein